MAMTAWETCVEDRVLEATTDRLRAVDDRSIVLFIQGRLDDEIKRLHNPNAEKAIQLFLEYAGVDIAGHWSWNQNEPRTVRDRLNEYIRLRGDVVHRSRAIESGRPRSHPVTKQDLQRAIRILKNLVHAT